MPMTGLTAGSRYVLDDQIGQGGMGVVWPVHDMIVEGDQLALVMDLIEGGDLCGHLRRRGGRLSGGEAASLGAQVCDGLAAAHAAGIVHRLRQRQHCGRQGILGHVGKALGGTPPARGRPRRKCSAS